MEALQPRLPCTCVLHSSGAESLQGEAAVKLWVGGQAVSEEHAVALQLPMLVLLQQHRPHQAGDGGVVGKDADDASGELSLLIDLVKQVGAPNLMPVGSAGGGERPAPREQIK
jgi:hypothetical protein